MLFDIPRQHQYLSALTDNDVALHDDIVPVRFEVRAGVGVTHFTLPVDGEVSRANVKRIFCTSGIHPVTDQLKRLGEVGMIGVLQICVVALYCGRLVEFAPTGRLVCRSDRGLLHRYHS